tara:strand:+ start:311 stop:688 length:378 start_codon:yes stop_codon:yes gene_type:complete
MKIDRMNKGEWGKLRAFFDLRTNEGIVIKGFKLVEGVNGLFVGMPSQKGKDDEFFDTVFMEREIRDKLNDLAMDEYNNPSSNPEATSTATASTTSNTSNEPASVDEVATSSDDGVQPFDDNDVPF